MNRFQGKAYMIPSFLKILALAFLSLLLLSGCATHLPQRWTQRPDEVSIMTYNVENLFDTAHDKGKDDLSFLPLSLKAQPKHKAECQKITNPRYKEQCLHQDWSDSVLEEKMQRLAQVILQVNNGRGADLVFLQEVENINVLKQLNDKYLKSAQYKHIVLLEGPDHRGIDTAFLSRLEMTTPPQLHKIPFKGKSAEDQKKMEQSRSILQATFRLPTGTPLTAFAIHFPSPGHPSYWRKQAISHLNYLKSQVPKDHLVIAGGDFNITAKEDQKNRLYQKELAEKWLVSHLIGCRQCKGTEFFSKGQSWSFLDALLFDKKFQDRQAPWQIDVTSISVAHRVPLQNSSIGTPARFDKDNPVGVSDHWPVYARLKSQAP
ncbi:MAG: endonuclease/exonuclease/phosphatase family protein [Bdellovibrionales bacterium]|nr:endonuclease/exonuclease/phosphatase family protein [Bdellovibrionales bacterium]